MPIEFKNQRIMTTAVLAEQFGTEDKIISNNFNRNIARFVEGKHYYRLEGEELKQFKGYHLNDESLKYVSILYLWTEMGAARHAKILDTDEAWDVYEQLEDTYFKVKKIAQVAQTAFKGLSPDKALENCQFLLGIAQAAGVSTMSQALITKTIYKAAGIDLPIDVVSEQSYYDGLGIAKKIGLYSTSNKPHGQAVTAIIDKLDIEEDEMASVWESTSNWQGTVTKYSESVIEKVKNWLYDNGKPTEIKGNKKTFKVVYKEELVALNFLTSQKGVI
jgi:hypothetical protein